MNKIFLSSVALALALLAGSAKAADVHVTAILLTKIKAPEKVDQHWQAHACDAAHADCANPCLKGVGLYQAKSSAANQFYALLPGPTLARMQFTGGQWLALEHWSFAEYEPSERTTGDVHGDDEPVCNEIYPALYPVGPQRLSVAVTSEWHEMYSGGGGYWQMADFVEIQQGGKIERVVSGMPFSCDKSIRACFDERDYKNDHCSEDSDGHLTLAWSKTDTQAYDWVATWHESLWPGQLPKSKTEKTSHTETLSPLSGKAVGRPMMKAIKFCEPVDYCPPEGCPAQ